MKIALLLVWGVLMALVIAPQNLSSTFTSKYTTMPTDEYSFLLFVGSEISAVVDMSYIMAIVFIFVIPCSLGMRWFVCDDLSFYKWLRWRYMPSLVSIPVIVALHLFGNFHYFFYYQIGVIPVYQLQMTWRTFLASLAGLILVVVPMALAIAISGVIGGSIWTLCRFCCFSETVELTISNASEV